MEGEGGVSEFSFKPDICTNQSIKCFPILLSTKLTHEKDVSRVHPSPEKCENWCVVRIPLKDYCGGRFVYGTIIRYHILDHRDCTHPECHRLLTEPLHLPSLRSIVESIFSSHVFPSGFKFVAQL